LPIAAQSSQTVDVGHGCRGQQASKITVWFASLQVRQSVRWLLQRVGRTCRLDPNPVVHLVMRIFGRDTTTRRFGPDKLDQSTSCIIGVSLDLSGQQRRRWRCKSEQQ
jgi:hypothetical protein